MNNTRNTTNASAALTDVGRASSQQHAVRRIADEFGLNRKQRLAFFLIGNAWTSRDGALKADSLRLHVPGGAGSEKSYVLKEIIVALIGCPALKGVVQPGRLPTIASQGKQAASVGGSTAYSTAYIPHRKKRGSSGDGALDNTDGQSALPEEKATKWLGADVIAIEEVSMVSCQLCGYINKAAATV